MTLPQSQAQNHCHTHSQGARPIPTAMPPASPPASPTFFSFGTVALPNFKTDKLRAQYRTQVLPDRSLKVTLVQSPPRSSKFTHNSTIHSRRHSTVASSSNSIDSVPVYASQRLPRFEGTPRKLMGHTGHRYKAKLVVQLDLAFPGQIAQYLGVAASAAASAGLLATAHGQLEYMVAKVSAACFYQGVAQLVVAAAAAATSPQAEETALARALAAFDLGNCGPLSDAYAALDHLRTVAVVDNEDDVEVLDAQTSMLRWLYYGLCLDPDVARFRNKFITMEALKQYGRRNSDTTNKATLSASLTRLFLTCDWAFYTELVQLLTSPAMHHFSVQYPVLFAQALSLSLPSDQALYPHDWLAAIVARHPTFNIRWLGTVISAEFVFASDGVTPARMAESLGWAAARYMEDCRRVVVEPLCSELAECYDMFRVTPLVKEKWMVVVHKESPRRHSNFAMP